MLFAILLAHADAVHLADVAATDAEETTVAPRAGAGGRDLDIAQHDARTDDAENLVPALAAGQVAIVFRRQTRKDDPVADEIDGAVEGILFAARERLAE